MNHIDQEQFTSLLKTERVKSRLVRELRFNRADTTNWDDLEVLAVSTRSKNEGLLLIQLDKLYLLPYELITGLKDNTTGRSKPVTCDFCYTWQRGGRAARITFRRMSDDHTFTYICCDTLDCSLNVREKTAESILSRTQLREEITEEQRINRLEKKLQELITTLDSKPVTSG